MSSQASSSKEVVAPNPQPPPKPPEELPEELQGGKFIFFTLDTLFNRDYAIECALKRCRDLNKDLQSKSMDELKRAYRVAMDKAYRQHIETQLRGPGFHHNSNPQGPTDKVGLLFEQLNLNLPTMDKRKLIGIEFAAEFNRNRFEATGASLLLTQLKRLGYSIVVVDHSFNWEVVKHLNFWHDVRAMILTEDLMVRKPDPRVFQRALNGCQVSAKNALIVGCSVEEDIYGILAAGAEPILYMPGHNYMTVDVRGTRVPVVCTMAELSSEIHLRPENSQLVPVSSGQSSHRVSPDSNPPLHSSGGSAPRGWLPSMRLHPLTEDYGISIRNSNHNEDRDQPRSRHDGYGHGTSRDMYTDHGGYPPPPPPPPDHPCHTSYQDLAGPWPGGYPPPTPPPPRLPFLPPAPSHASYQDQTRSWREGREYETSENRYTVQGGYPPGPSAQHQSLDPELRDAAQSILDLARDIRRTDSSSRDVSKLPHLKANQYLANSYRSMNRLGIWQVGSSWLSNLCPMMRTA